MMFHTFRRVMLFLLPETETRDSDAGMRNVISFNLSAFQVLSRLHVLQGLGRTMITTDSAVTIGRHLLRTTFLVLGRYPLYHRLYWICSCFLSIRDFTPINGCSNPYATAFQGF